MKLHKNVGRSPKRNARAVASNLRRQHVDRPRKLKQKAGGGSSREAAVLRDQVHVHPVHALRYREDLVRPAERVVAARRTLDREVEAVTPDSQALSVTFDHILDLLTELDYVEITPGENLEDRSATQITTEGERLSRIHHESDLLIAQCLRRGVWDDLDPAELAAVASTVVFENRRESSGHHDDGFPTEPLAAAISAVHRIYGELVSDEDRHGLPLTREPQTGFATAIHQWAAGAPLDYCLRAAEAAGAQLTPGDFVRWCTRVIDLLEQVKHTGYADSVRAAARRAVPAIRRGVVELGATG